MTYKYFISFRAGDKYGRLFLDRDSPIDEQCIESIEHKSERLCGCTCIVISIFLLEVT